MAIFFEELLSNDGNRRILNVGYIRERNFSAIPVLDAFDISDLEYFDKTTGILPTPSYRLYHGLQGGDEEVVTVHSINALAHEFHEYFFEDTIIEYVGKDVFIWDVESECYVIFGDRNMLDLISSAAYGVESARKLIENAMNEEEKEFLTEFYKKYSLKP